MKIGMHHLVEEWRNNPLNAKAVPLPKHYTDAQCREGGADQALGVRLAHKELSDKKLMARVACLRGVGAAYLRTSKAARYYRRKPEYLPLGSRYHSGDPRDTHDLIANSMTDLHEIGFIVQTIGSRIEGKQSIAIPTDEGLAFLAEHVADPTALGEMKLPKTRSLILRGADKKLMEFTDTPETIALEIDTDLINEAKNATVWRHPDGSRVYIPDYRCIANVTFDRGTRLYCGGESYQGLPAEERAMFTCDVDGVPMVTDEVDVSCQHFTFAYWEAGVPVPAGDLYDITGTPRLVSKKSGNTMLNAANNSQAAASIGHELFTDPDFRKGTGLTAASTEGECRSYAWKVMRAIKAKHPAITHLFCSDAGARFQRMDGDWARAVMLEVFRLTGICPLYVYDSFHIPKRYKNLLRSVMKRVSKEMGINLTLKETTHNNHTQQPTTTHTPPTPHTHTPPTPTHTLHMGGYPPDQGLLVEGFPSEKGEYTPPDSTEVRPYLPMPVSSGRSCHDDIPSRSQGPP